MFANSDAAQVLAALGLSQATISFTPDGQILDANHLFLQALGYSLPEIKGKHHSMFVDRTETGTDSYKAFWRDLAAGKNKSAEFLRIAKGGREVWIRATYNPVLDSKGKVVKVVKFATDITEQKVAEFNARGKLDAINRSQAAIEFEPDGTIITANENFLKTMGFTLSEIVGRKHSMFMDPAERGSREYEAFWTRLREGRFESGEFRRIGKSGQSVWIQGAYNPILDGRGRVTAVVKFAMDVTEQVNRRHERDQIQRSIDSDLNGIAQSLSDTSNQTSSVASASGQASSSVNAMAAGAEELAASAREISQQLTRTATITREAVAKANATNAVVAGLNDSAKRISEVIKLISDVAAQTNLLALNATIEAARAGEAGRGFAVVASEVKGLAVQSARATEEISAQIAQVQSVTSQAAEAIASIGTTIGEIDEVASAVSAAVEEQSSVTEELTTKMQEVASGVEAINQAIGEIARTSQSVERATQNVRQASARLA